MTTQPDIEIHLSQLEGRLDWKSLNGNPHPVTEVYFDDRTLLSTYIEK